MMFNGSWLSSPYPQVDEVDDSLATKTLFRSVLDLSELENLSGEIWVSADSRYKFYLNGSLIAVGPAKANAEAWFVDKVPLPQSLLQESNVIGVEVLSYRNDESGNASVLRLGIPSLYVQATGCFAQLELVENWLTSPQQNLKVSQGINTQFLGIQETVDGAGYPHRWLTETYETIGWQRPSLTEAPLSATKSLQPRSIPQLTFTPGLFESVSIQNTDHDWLSLNNGEFIEIAAGSEVSVDFDAGKLLTGFLNLEISGGANAEITLEAAECYELPPIDVPWLRDKKRRDQPIGQDLYGDPDSYLVAGVGSRGAPEVYQPYWFRTFRFLRVRIRTSIEPVVIQALDFQVHNYPLAVTGSFATSDQFHQNLWEVSKHTLLNCMHETFEDCPFYEQLQYAMDTRSQVLFAMHLSSDDQLVRRAILDFAASGSPDGLTSSRSPSVVPQIIPNFSLFWIYMIHDHMMHQGDSGFLKPLLPRILAVLSTFRANLNDDSMVVSALDENVWNFVDWTEEWRSSRGVPNLGLENVNTISTFMFVAAIRKAAEIAQFVGELATSDELANEAIRIAENVREGVAFDARSGLYRDSNFGDPSSVHAQVWAVLSGVAEGQTAARVLRESLGREGFAQCSYAMSLSLFDALRLANLGGLVDWQPWQEMLNLGLTTWAEDTVSNRSDCHAWGSVPLQHFPKYELGVHPIEPGFAKVGIDPAVSQLSDARGAVPTPFGPIGVSWEVVAESGERKFSYSLPQRMSYQLTDLARDIRIQTLAGETQVSFIL